MGVRDIVRKDWTVAKKEDFFDYKLGEDVEMRLTYQLHYESLQGHPIQKKSDPAV